MARVMRTAANPGAGVSLTLIVPAGEYWVLEGIHFTFTTDATAPVRTVNMIFDSNGSNEYYRTGSNGTQAASLGVGYSFAPLVPSYTYAGTDLNRQVGLPLLVLAPSSQIYMNIVNFVAGDAQTNIKYIVNVLGAENVLLYGNLLRLGW